MPIDLEKVGWGEMMGVEQRGNSRNNLCWIMSVAPVAAAAVLSVTATTTVEMARIRTWVWLLLALGGVAIISWILSGLLSKNQSAASNPAWSKVENDTKAFGDSLEAFAEGNLASCLDIKPDILEPNVQESPIHLLHKDLARCATALAKGRARVSDTVQIVEQRARDITMTGGRIGDEAAQASEAATMIDTAMSDASRGIDEMSHTSLQFASGSEQLARSATEAANGVELLSGSITRVQVDSAQELEASSDALTIAQGGVTKAQSTAKAMATITSQVGEATEAVKRLGDRQNEIKSIVQTIQDIAAQTNLLALNAAIEAARAGDQGRGFAIVADEVRKLAERSEEATKEISSLIAGVNAGVSETVEAMASTEKQIEVGAQSTADTLESFDNILSAVSRVQTCANNTHAEVDKMSKNAVTVADAIASVAAVSEQSAAGAEQMSACSAELAATSQEVSSSLRLHEEVIRRLRDMVSQDLNGHADELMKVVTVFNTGKKDDFSKQVDSWKQAHRNWVKRVEAMVSSGKIIPRAELSSHKKCALGTWYEGPGRSSFGKSPEFLSIEEPHARVHDLAAEAVDAMEARDLKRAQKCVDEIREASRGVVSRLDGLANIASKSQAKAA